MCCRAGLDPDTEQLLREFDQVVYISCNPETLAKNLNAVADTHDIERFAVFDQVRGSWGQGGCWICRHNLGKGVCFCRTRHTVDSVRTSMQLTCEKDSMFALCDCSKGLCSLHWTQHNRGPDCPMGVPLVRAGLFAVSLHAPSGVWSVAAAQGPEGLNLQLLYCSCCTFRPRSCDGTCNMMKLFPELWDC